MVFGLDEGTHTQDGGSNKIDFTITAEIHVRSFVNFYGQYVDRHINLKFMQCVCPVIGNEFRHNIVKSSLLSPYGSTATLSML